MVINPYKSAFENLANNPVILETVLLNEGEDPDENYSENLLLI